MKQNLAWDACSHLKAFVAVYVCTQELGALCSLEQRWRVVAYESQVQGQKDFKNTKSPADVLR